MEKASECVRVGIRCRPLSSKETRENEGEIVVVDESRGEVVLKPNDSTSKPVIFTYDFVFNQQSRQDSLYQTCAAPIIDCLLQGFNCTIFAYGQTGTGKTFTMEGADDGDSMGIIPRSFQQVFDHIRQNSNQKEFLVRCSLLELYNEELKDSLNPDKKAEKLEIHEDPKTGFYVKGLSLSTVKSPEELLKKLYSGKATRQVRATEMNDFSSRSHSIFSLIIESSEKGVDGQSHFKIGKLNLVDLAGSEKQKQTKTTNEALKEGININLSLTTLGNVINLLVQGAPHVPYRNSKLTKLLSDSLGGNSKTLMIANVGPARSNHAETLQTLKYANRAKQIKNKPIVNEDAKDALLRQKQEELNLLRLQIQQMASSNTQLSSVLRDIGSFGDKEKENSKLGSESDLRNNEILENIKREGQNIQEEQTRLRQKVQETREKMRKAESDKEELVSRYNKMCRDIISDHDYAQDLQSAKEELNKMALDGSEQQRLQEVKKIFQEKKQEKDHFGARSKQIQDSINEVNAQITSLRDQIANVKQSRTQITSTNQLKIEELNEKILKNRETLKRQQFFLLHLIPKHFQRLHDNKKFDDPKLCIPSIALQSLRRPLSLLAFSETDSYINAFQRDLPPKNKKTDFPTLAQIIDDGKLKRNS